MGARRLSPWRHGLRRAFRRRADRRETAPDPGLPEVVLSWHARDEELTETGTATIARRLPSLALVAGAVALRAGLQAGAGWAQARLDPQVERLVELRLYETTTAVDLTALDDPDFLDDLKRAEGRGMMSAPQVVQHAVDVLTGLIGLVAAAGTLGVLHPLLLPLLLLTAVPEGWASVRSARMRYLMMPSLIGVTRRKWISPPTSAGSSWTWPAGRPS